MNNEIKFFLESQNIQEKYIKSFLNNQNVIKFNLNLQRNGKLLINKIVYTYFFTIELQDFEIIDTKNTIQKIYDYILKKFTYFQNISEIETFFGILDDYFEIGIGYSIIYDIIHNIIVNL